RARGADWRRTESLPGGTVVHQTAQIRVVPPVPVDSWPPELARLQVGRAELRAPEPPPAVDPGPPLVVVAAGLEAGAGNALARAGHAAQLGWRAMRSRPRRRWRDDDYRCAVRTATPEQWQAVLRSRLAKVHDAGFTEVAPGSVTAAFVPVRSSV